MSNAASAATIRNFTGAVKAGGLLLVGLCSECRGDVARVGSGGEVVQGDLKRLTDHLGELLKAFKDYDLKRVISFHSRVKRAEAFAQDLHQVSDWIGQEHRPSGKFQADFVSGDMPTDRRRRKLAHLKAIEPGERGLLTNARCLSEGVDVPSLDGVAFIDPRSSQIDIIQAVGRAIRLSPDKKIGTIVLPVFIGDPRTDAFEEGIRHVQEFIDREGHCCIPSLFKSADGYRVGSWVNTQRTNRSKQPPDRRLRLEGLPGWVWKVSS